MKKSASGFTLIEVMVATGILLVMVLMIASLFRQATNTWDSGYVRAEGGMIVRGVLGAIARDLQTAVDGRRFGKEAIKCDGGSLSFYCEKPWNGVSYGDDSDGPLRKITYSISGSKVSRSEATVDAKGATCGNSTSSTLYDGGTKNDKTGASFTAKFTVVSQNDVDVDDRPYEGKAWEGILWKGPASVRIRLELSRTGRFAGVRVYSTGPDGVPNGDAAAKGEDDIILR